MDKDETPNVIISRNAALAAIGALSLLERTSNVDKDIKAALREIMDALVISGRQGIPLPRGLTSG